MITKPNINSWYTEKEQVIKYDGKACTSRCGNDIDCPHEEIWAKHLVDIFDIQSYDNREKIIKYLSEEDFDDYVTELYDTHCSDCLGTGEVGEMVSVYPNEPHLMADTRPCHCQNNHDE